MALGLRAQAALSEGLDSIPRTYMVSHNSIPGDPASFSLWAPDMHMVTDIYAGTPIKIHIFKREVSGNVDQVVSSKLGFNQASAPTSKL